MMKFPSGNKRILRTSTTLAALLLAGAGGYTQTVAAAEFIEGGGWFFRSGEKTFVSFSTECEGGSYKNRFQLQDNTTGLRVNNGNITSVTSNGSDTRTLQGTAQIVLGTGEVTTGTFRTTITASTDNIVVELSTGHIVSSNLQSGDVIFRFYDSASCTVSGSDLVPPSVSLTSPANNAEIAGSFMLSATASDNSSGVAGVQFMAGGLLLGAEDTSAPYELSLNSINAANGSYMLQAKVRDNAGNTARSDFFPVLVKNPANSTPETTRPSITITSPSNGVTVSGSGTAQTSASDTGSGIAGVQFFVDGAAIGSEDTSAPYQLTGDTAVLSNGPHLLMASVRDYAGNRGNSPSVLMNVNNGSNPPAPVIQRFEQTDSSITYTGLWLNIDDPRPSGGSVLESNQSGSSATLNFTGTGVTWIGFRCTCAAGTARVYLDGNYVGAADSFAATEEAKAPIYSVQGLSNSAHTLKIEVTGTYHADGETAYLIIDAFDVKK